VSAHVWWKSYAEARLYVVIGVAPHYYAIQSTCKASNILVDFSTISGEPTLFSCIRFDVPLLISVDTAF
jgi:hypothetical protein